LICINAAGRQGFILLSAGSATVDLSPSAATHALERDDMNSVSMDRKFLLAFRLLMGWTFLYAGAWQVLSPTFSAADFLANTKTFHDLYAPLTAPGIAPVLTFFVKWGHLLIGLSLVSGLLVRVSGIFGVALLLTYWTAHMNFPYIETHVNLIIDYHIVYSTVTIWLVAANAGHVWGLDGWLAERRVIGGRAPAMG
jgi:thiosulfate dehydrogenase (quinone) large subunit